VWRRNLLKAKWSARCWTWWRTTTTISKSKMGFRVTIKCKKTMNRWTRPYLIWSIIQPLEISENLLKNLLVQTQAIGNISKDVLIRKTPTKLRRLNTNFSIIERQDHPKLRELLSQCQATTTSSLPKLIASKGSRMLTQTSPTLVGGKDDSLSTAMTQKPFITQLSS